jgi:flavin reductase (DIM6/NTAB) family NADH-FMN oxidoreductase RutF
VESTEAFAPPAAQPPTGSWVEAGAYRTLMSLFPTGVAVVTSLDRGGLPRGATCSSLASVTLDPPTLLVCLKLSSSTLDALRGRGSFAVNLLHARARHIAEVFAAPVYDRFADVAWKPVGPTGMPWLVRDAFAVACCRVYRQVVVGDHAVVLGNVTGIEVSPDVPLLYGLRQFSTWPTPI